jgi:hypothetical protein
MRKIRFLLLALLIGLTGCAKNIVRHPVTDKDIKQVDGYICMSPEYIQEVMKARLDQ